MTKRSTGMRTRKQRNMADHRPTSRKELAGSVGNGMAGSKWIRNTHLCESSTAWIKGDCIGHLISLCSPLPNF